MSALAAHASNSAGPLAALIILVVCGGLVAVTAAAVIIRVMRGRRPREQQLADLAGRLDGRSRVSIRKVEIGLGQADIHWVAQSRGYSLIDHRFGKYYEFVYTPHQPGRVA
jgi:hypothetical protein